MKKLFVFLILTASVISAQMGHNLVVIPPHLHFPDLFHRQNNITVENRSSTDIRIDSIVYDHSIYNITLRSSSSFPINLTPTQSFNFNVLLYNYFSISDNDSLSVIKIYNNSPESIVELDLHIPFYMHNGMKGIVTGIVRDTSGIIPQSMIYFFYNGTILMDSVLTTSDGTFSKELPGGRYFIAAYKAGYYMKYAYDKDTPLDADYIYIKKDTIPNIEFILDKEPETGLSVSGEIIDNDNLLPLSKAIVVVRKGKHTPSKISAAKLDQPDRDYTVFSNTNGEYFLNNINGSGNFYIQAFAPFYLPGYFNKKNQPVLFWQDADSVEISGNTLNRNIYLDHDSSYGAGVANGSVIFNNSQNQPVTGAIVYSVSDITGKIYSYNFSASSGRFNFQELPYGSYKLISQKIGLSNAESEPFSITTNKDSIFNLTINMITTSVENNQNYPDGYFLYQNYPNPFNPQTTIKYSLLNSNYVSLNIYNILGKRIAELVNSRQAAGQYEVVFNASGLPSGIYYYTLHAGSFSQTRKLILLK